MKIAINNAGMILMLPFLPQFFERVHLTENDSFVNYEAQNRAVYLLQYLVFDSIDFPEYLLPLNKLLAGLSVEEPITQINAITADEKTMCESLLLGIITNWEKVGNSTPEAIQESFFQREGILNIENINTLTVERKGIDALMQTIPWGFHNIKLPWMEKPLEVEW